MGSQVIQCKKGKNEIRFYLPSHVCVSFFSGIMFLNTPVCMSSKLTIFLFSLKMPLVDTQRQRCCCPRFEKFNAVDVIEIWGQWVGNVIIPIMWSTAGAWKRPIYMSCISQRFACTEQIQQIFFGLVSPTKLCYLYIASGFILPGAEHPGLFVQFKNKC